MLALLANFDATCLVPIIYNFSARVITSKLADIKRNDQSFNQTEYLLLKKSKIPITRKTNIPVKEKLINKFEVSRAFSQFVVVLKIDKIA